MTSETLQVSTDWSTDPTKYEFIGKIGQGAFASVWKARITDRQQDCAVKVLNLDHVDTNLTEIRREVQAMRLSSHANVLKCYTSFVHDRELWLVTQLMRKGSSLHCLQTARKVMKSQSSPMPKLEPHIMYILHECLLGLQYIHENGQIHRDVKAGNILLGRDGDVRIADFGVSGWLVQGGLQQEKANTFVGTPCWMSPELMEQIHGYDYKTDIWSLGITAMELAKGYAPYGKFPPMKVLILTIQEDPPTLDTYNNYDDSDADDTVEEDWSRSFSNMIQLCLQKNPVKRPTDSDLLQSKHFASFADERFRKERRERIRTEICSLVPDVGDRPSSQQRQKQASNLPGHTPVSFVISKESEDRPAGTTWVFADGSQVLASKSVERSVDDVLDELEQIGGENYDKSMTEKQKATDINKEDDDGLNDFLDEFEKTTVGENFRQPNH